MKQLKRFKGTSLHISSTNTAFKETLKEGRRVKKKLDLTKDRNVKRRLKWIEYYHKTGNARKTCRYFGISPTTFYKWKKRYDKYGIEGLQDRNKRPHKVRQPQTEPEIEHIIVTIREKFPTWSKEKIAAFMERYLNVKISSSTVYRVLKRHGLIERTWKLKSTYKRKKQKGKKNRTRKGLRADKPGTILMDVKYLYWCGKTFYQFTAIDKFTRIAFAKVYSTKSSRSGRRFFEELEKFLPFKIEKVQTDNGSEFLGELDEYLKRKGIEHYFSYPKSPKTNAHVERFIQTTESELWMIEGTEPTVDEMNKKLFEYLKIYNFLRPHHSLNYKTPAEKFEDYIRSHQGVHHVLNSNRYLTLKNNFLYYSPSSKCRLSSAG
ncbi:Integrase catalytic region [Desulfurobacterium thermolithotrophum DSM 11699]|uniref:Integrase catalytic region n=1 Tax=Desulfurobacterium thermolithotrophum (strain DSM 11699 / BSA) TaxID=868864 RepID=F0S273_DESTD|nr:IS481 family transposase [Desulfurobacterium thermolithotrophum]ADY73016.1 Integrase catalytic region [Desulfurobacterium thermolithotrophum DSM 11699]